MRKLLILIVVSAVITGCSMFPRTESELVTSGNKSEPMCFIEEKSIIEDRIKGYLGRCFKPDFVFTSASSGFSINHRVKESKTPEKTTYNVYTPSGVHAGYFLNVKIDQALPECHTTVSVVAMNMFWEDEFEKIREAAKGIPPICSL